MKPRQVVMSKEVREDLKITADVARQAQRTLDLARTHIAIVCAQQAACPNLPQYPWSYEAETGVVTWVEPDESAEKSAQIEGAEATPGNLAS